MIHDSIPPASAPGGLVFVTYDASDNEIVRSVIPAGRIEQADQLAEDAAEAHGQAGGGGYLVAYDGDTGEQHWRSDRFPPTDREGHFLEPQQHTFETLLGLTPTGLGLEYKWPWMIVGVFSPREYIHEGETGAEWWHQFCYTSGLGLHELWAPCASIEGRLAGHDLVGEVLNVLAYNYATGYLSPGETVHVPLGVPDGEDVTTVWWIGEPTTDHDRYQSFKTAALAVVPVRWSSGLGWPDE